MSVGAVVGALVAESDVAGLEEAGSEEGAADEVVALSVGVALPVYVEEALSDVAPAVSVGVAVAESVGVTVAVSVVESVADALAMSVEVGSKTVVVPVSPNSWSRPRAWVKSSTGPKNK